MCEKKAKEKSGGPNSEMVLVKFNIIYIIKAPNNPTKQDTHYYKT